MMQLDGNKWFLKFFEFYRGGKIMYFCINNLVHSLYGQSARASPTQAEPCNSSKFHVFNFLNKCPDLSKYRKLLKPSNSIALKIKFPN